jgi:hypothetical protein
MSRLLKTVFVVLVIAAFTNVSRAQDENIIRPSTKQGSAAWMFAFGGLSTMGLGAVPVATVTAADVSGTGFSSAPVLGAGFKTYLADDLALRAILGFSTTSSGDEAKGGSNSLMAFGIAAGIEMHTHDVYSTSPYFGAQIAFASSSETNKSTPSGGTTTESTGKGSTFGIGVFAGFDWYFTRGIAIGGEYGLMFSSMSSSFERTGVTAADIPGTTMIAIGAASIHAIVHF